MFPSWWLLPILYTGQKLQAEIPTVYFENFCLSECLRQLRRSFFNTPRSTVGSVYSLEWLPFSALTRFWALSSASGQFYIPDSKPFLGARDCPVFLRLHCIVFSITPSLLPTPVSFKYTNNVPTTRSFARSSANHFLSGRPCHRIPLLSKFLFRTLRSVLHFQPQAVVVQEVVPGSLLNSLSPLILHIVRHW